MASQAIQERQSGRDSSENARILVVEDDQQVAKIEVKALEKHGYVVETAGSVDQAIEMLAHSGSFDLAIVDYYLEQFNAVDLIERLPEGVVMPPYLVVSGVEDTNNVLEMMKLGALDFAFKTRDFISYLGTLVKRTLDNIATKKELNKTIRELERSRQKLEKGVIARTKELEQTNQRLVAEKDALQKAHERLKKNRVQILQQEKLATLGQIAAGVAHEINNPVGFILSNIETMFDYTEIFGKCYGLMKKLCKSVMSGDLDSARSVAAEIQRVHDQEDMDYVIEDIGQLLAESREGAHRVRAIVQNLKNFARAKDDESGPVDLNACIESTLKIVWNELKYKCNVVKNLGDIPLVQGFAGQLNQVFLNLLVNAAQAIEEKGEVRIETRLEEGTVKVAISDTGCGIPDEIVSRIFEPFFTTKEAGKGTGLGLAISNDIVRKHGGELKVESELGKGTTFTVEMPVPADEDTVAACTGPSEKGSR
ncbi:MAG: response regulator [Deltaproteobacteria bacterium]|nr:response regulator [Deltaproteobacteria bacterium]